jgi:hypothetical protein
LPDEFLDAEWLAVAGIKRGHAFVVELRAQPSQLLDMRQKLPTDQLLIGIRKGRRLSNRSFECSYHAASYQIADAAAAHRLPGLHVTWSFILHPGRSYHLEEAGYRVRIALDDD